MKLNLTVITILLLINSFISVGQEFIKEANISLELPNDSWELVNKTDQNEAHIYYYKRTPIVDNKGRSVIPNISVIVENVNEDLDVVTYSAFKRGQVNFDVIEMFIHGDGIIDFVNAVGYKGKYNDQYGEHTIYMIYAINEGKGVQIIFDVLTELFTEVDPEFKITLKSIAKNK